MSQTGKPVVTFMLSSKRNRHKSHKWFLGHYSLVEGTVGILDYFFLLVAGYYFSEATLKASLRILTATKRL